MPVSASQELLDGAMSEKSEPSSRRRQPKSKKGCRTCKTRRVKCDEHRPACGNCAKYGVRCDYMPSIKACTSSPSLTLTETTFFNGFGGALSMDDLELFHHYHISTCFTFSTEPLVRGFWQLAAPRMGFSAPHILRGILAVAALHLSRLRREREGFYLSRAFMHFDLALDTALPLLADTSVNNCEKIFVFSVLSKIVALAKPKDDSDLLLANQQTVPDWLSLFRSRHQILGKLSEEEQFPSIAIIFDRGPPPHDGWFLHGSEKDALDELEANMYNSLSKDIDALAAVVDALDRLRHAFVLFFNEGALSRESQLRGIIGWLRRVSDAYIALVAEGNYEALCVLSFYCVLLRRLEFIWWIEGWSFHLVERIYSRLPVKYRLWIRWPIQEVGWAPP